MVCTPAQVKAFAGIRRKAIPSIPIAANLCTKYAHQAHIGCLAIFLARAARRATCVWTLTSRHKCVSQGNTKVILVRLLAILAAPAPTPCSAIARARPVRPASSVQIAPHRLQSAAWEPGRPKDRPAAAHATMAIFASQARQLRRRLTLCAQQACTASIHPQVCRRCPAKEATTETLGAPTALQHACPARKVTTARVAPASRFRAHRATFANRALTTLRENTWAIT